MPHVLRVVGGARARTSLFGPGRSLTATDDGRGHLACEGDVLQVSVGRARERHDGGERVDRDGVHDEHGAFRALRHGAGKGVAKEEVRVKHDE